MNNFSKILVTAVLVSGLFSVSPAIWVSAQEANCADPQTSLEMKICAGRELQDADDQLNANYRQARAEMRRIDRDLPPDLSGAELTLRDAQRAWIKFRDLACDTRGFIFRGGTLETVVVTACLTRLTKQRSEELQLLFIRN